jgi:hypothetical protein
VVGGSLAMRGNLRQAKGSTMRKLLASAFSALAMLFVAVSIGDVPGSDDAATTAAGTVRGGWGPGPDGIDPQHNETLVRDAS